MGESGLKWLSILGLFLLALVALAGAGWGGWYLRGVQADAAAGARSATALSDLEQGAATLLEATRIAASRAQEARRNSEAASQEVAHALHAAGLSDCPVPADAQRVLADQAAQYNAATGR